MDRCITERGHVLDPYHVLEIRHWCMVVALTPDGEMVLVEEYRHARGEVTRGVPAGTVEKGEDPEAAMRRELQEETGYTSDTWIMVNRLWANPALQDNEVFMYLALDASPGAARALDPGETIDVFTVPAADAIAQTMNGGPICHALQVSGLLSAREYARSHVADDPRLAALLG
jgi:8-oxo-dGTP pyrophosphatase MutT (NUDIX family)